MSRSFGVEVILKPNFFVRNNLEFCECRVLVSKWTPEEQWEKIVTGFLEVDFSIESARVYFHFVEGLGQKKLFEIDLKDFSCKLETLSSIALIHKNCFLDIALAFENPSSAQKYFVIIENFSKIKDQILEITKYKDQGKCLFSKINTLIPISIKF